MFLTLFGANIYLLISISFFVIFSDDPVQTHTVYQEISNHSDRSKETENGKEASLKKDL